MFEKLNHDVIFYILNICELDAICSLSAAFPEVKQVVLMFKNSLFKKLYLSLLSPAQIIFHSEIMNDELYYFDMYFHRLFESISSGNITKKELENVLLYCSILDKRDEFIEYVQKNIILESWYEAIIDKRPIWPGYAKKDVFKIVTKLLNYGCRHSPLILVGAILVGDKKSVKYIMAKDQDILTRSVKTVNNVELPFAFYLQHQVALLKRNNKITKRQESYIHSFINFILLKLPSNSRVWYDGASYWTVKSYYLYLLSDT